MAERKRSSRKRSGAGDADDAPNAPETVREAPSQKGAATEGNGRGASSGSDSAAVATSAAEGSTAFSRLNWMLSLAGVVTLLAGFLILSKANVAADNLPARLAPPMILGAYLLIFVAIIARAPSGRSDSDRSGKKDGQ